MHLQVCLHEGTGWLHGHWRVVGRLTDWMGGLAVDWNPLHVSNSTLTTFNR